MSALLTSKDYFMAVEIFQLSAQIQQWLNARIARHLAAQAAKFTRRQDDENDTVNA